MKWQEGFPTAAGRASGAANRGVPARLPRRGPRRLGRGTARSGRTRSPLRRLVAGMGRIPSLASADTGFPNDTDHGVGNRRRENLRAQLLIPTGRPRRLAAPDARPAAIESAGVVPDGSGRWSAPTSLVTGSRPERFLAMTHVFVIRGARRSRAGVCRDRMALKQAGSHRGGEEPERRTTSRRATRPQPGRDDRRASRSARCYSQVKLP